MNIKCHCCSKILKIQTLQNKIKIAYCQDYHCKRFSCDFLLLLKNKIVGYRFRIKDLVISGIDNKSMKVPYYIDFDIMSLKTNKIKLKTVNLYYPTFISTPQGETLKYINYFLPLNLYLPLNKQINSLFNKFDKLHLMS